MSDVGASGYLHSAYAEAVAGSGRPVFLEGCGGWIIARRIEGTHLEDAAGCYPFFTCRNWSRIGNDLEELRDRFVCLSLVTDPFGDFERSSLQEIFRDRFALYKRHLITDLEVADAQTISTHHRRNIAYARRMVDVEISQSPYHWVNEFAALYANLVARHQIRGAANFGVESLAKQMSTPGITAIKAVTSGETVGMTLWYTIADVTYYHLGAYSDAGYARKSAFALFAAAIEFFRLRSRWLALGAGAGIASDGNDGLTRFKRGWATGTRDVFLCGAVLRRTDYAKLDTGRAARGFFPSYRAPTDSSQASE